MSDVQTASVPAAAHIARQHIDLVYSTARRLVSDSALADDVTQAVFLVFARKQSSVRPETLSGWLVNCTRLVSLEAIRRQRTDRRHDQAAAQLRREAVGRTDEPSAEQVARLLDQALGQLREPDRSAVVMRFLEGQSFADVAAVIGCSPDAARKRVERALEKLRKILMDQGVAPSVAALTVALAASQSSAAPPAVVAAVGTAGSPTAVSLAATIPISVLPKMLIAALVVVATLVIGTVVSYQVSSKQQVSSVPASQSVSATQKVVGEWGRVVTPGEPAPHRSQPQPPSVPGMNPVHDMYGKIFLRLDETQEERARADALKAQGVDISAYNAKAIARIWQKIEVAVNEMAERRGLQVDRPASMPPVPDRPEVVGIERVREIIQQRMIVSMNERMADEVVARLNTDYRQEKTTQPATRPW